MSGGKKEGYYHIVESELAEEVGGRNVWGGLNVLRESCR